MHTTALCSPTRSCILTGRNHHSNHMAAITEVSTGFPGYDGYIPFENGFLSEMLLGQGYNTYAVGKWHLTPADQISAAGPYDRWPLGRGFERYYGFLGGDTHQYYPELDLRQPPGRAAEDARGGLPPHRGPGRQAPSASWPTPSRSHPTSPSSCTSLPGAMHAPHHVPKEWADKYEGVFDDGWDAYREKVFARQKELGIVPADAELSRHDPDVPDWDSLSRRRAPAVRADDGGLRRLPGAHRPPHRPAARLPRGDRRARQHADHGHQRQRRQRRGRPHRLHQREQVLQLRPGRPASRTSPPSTTSAGPSTSTTTPGAGPGPATRPSGAGSARPTAAASATRSSSTGPPASRPRARCATSTGTPSTWCPTVLDLLDIEPPTHIRGVQQSPIEGVSMAHALDDADAPPATHHAVLRDARPPLHLPRRLEGGLPLAGHVVRRGPALRHAHPGGEADRAGRHGLGALPPRRGLDREPRRGRRAPRQAHRDDRALVRRGRQVQRAAGRRPRPAALRRRAPRDRLRSLALHLLPGHPGGARQRGTAAAQPTAQRPRRASRSPRRAPRACWSARAAWTAATRSTSRTASCATATTTWPTSTSTSPPTPRCPRGRHILQLRVRADRRAGAAQGQGRAGHADALRRRPAGRLRATCR